MIWSQVSDGEVGKRQAEIVKYGNNSMNSSYSSSETVVRLTIRENFLSITTYLHGMKSIRLRGQGLNDAHASCAGIGKGCRIPHCIASLGLLRGVDVRPERDGVHNRHEWSPRLPTVETALHHEVVLAVKVAATSLRACGVCGWCT